MTASGARQKSGYLPTLDGWRAIAILSVVFYHDSLHSMGPLSTGWLFRNGYCGVDLFFAISGLLICWRLLEEEKAFGEISLRGFYIRRAFRILPPAFACLGGIALLTLAGVFHVTLRQLLGAAFFFRNYTFLLGTMGADKYFTEHFWSLAVEEHFYFILPGLLVLTRRRWRLQVLLGLCLIIEIHRAQVLESRPWAHVLFHSDMRMDALLVPATLAVLAQSAAIRQKLKQWLRVWPLLLILVLIVVSNWEGTFWGETLVVLLMPLTVLGSLLNPGGLLARPLEWAPLRYVGRLSYSLYLWQQLFFTGHFFYSQPLGVLQGTWLRFVVAPACAIASYHLLERPFIKLGHKLAPPATPGREDLVASAPGNTQVATQPTGQSGG